jgi:hypothetical protein
MSIDTRPETVESQAEADARLLRKATLLAAVNPDTVVAALFVSDLPLSSDPDPVIVADAVVTTVQRFTESGCVVMMAEEFGNHRSDAALKRMHWVRTTVVALKPSASRRASLK